MKLAIIVSMAALFVLTLSFSAPAQDNNNNNEIIKWIQPPDMRTGFDQQSQWDFTDGEPDVIKADDWICPDGLLVTDIHWWGSYFADEQFEPDAFYVNIYANDDRDLIGDPSDDMPGTWLWGVLADFPGTSETFYGIDSVGEAVYEYSVYLPEGWEFDQDQGVKYWLSIVASTPDHGSVPIWGWHTGFEPVGLYGLSSAVTGKVLMGDDWARGNPDEWAHEDYNFAFALTTVPEPGTIVLIGGGILALLGLRRRK